MRAFSENGKQVVFTCNTCGKSIQFEADFWGNYSDLLNAGWCGQQYFDENNKLQLQDFCSESCCKIIMPDRTPTLSINKEKLCLN